MGVEGLVVCDTVSAVCGTESAVREALSVLSVTAAVVPNVGDVVLATSSVVSDVVNVVFVPFSNKATLDVVSSVFAAAAVVPDVDVVEVVSVGCDAKLEEVVGVMVEEAADGGGNATSSVMGDVGADMKSCALALKEHHSMFRLLSMHGVIVGTSAVQTVIYAQCNGWNICCSDCYLCTV